MWNVGDRVLAKRSSEDYWYPGVIRHIDGGRLYVIFDDGEDALVAQEQLLGWGLEVGDQVFARTMSGDSYARGRIVDKADDKLYIRYENGKQAWASLGMVRIQRATWKESPETTAGKTGWATGDRVLACWFDLDWYPGIVLAADDNRLYILFDTGNQALVHADKVRPLELAAGERVLCRYRGGFDYYPGEVTQVDGEKVHIQYDDGDEETTSVRLLRLQRDDWLPAADQAGLAEGTRVLACWFDQFWYPGVVLAVEGKRFHILFDDGDQGLATADRVKRLVIAAGDHVFCRWKGGPVFYPGEVTRRDGERIHVQYEDGDEEWTSVRLVRVEG